MSKASSNGGEDIVTDSDDKILEELPPKRFLDTSNARLIKAGLHCMHSRETIQQYLAYENQHKNRTWVQRFLARRARELADEQSE